MSSFSSQSVSEFLSRVAAKAPTPGGGAVASTVGALAAALAHMVVSYSIGKKNLAAHQADLEAAAKVLTRSREVLLQLADEDAAAYGLVNELARLPEADPRRRAEYPAACQAAVQVPLAVMAAGVDLLRLFDRLAPITNKHLSSDLGIAVELARATVEASNWNVEINVGALNASARDATLQQAGTLRHAASEIVARVDASCLATVRALRANPTS
jgi:formiminotetrahydrofolate cyclodeaminase